MPRAMYLALTVFVLPVGLATAEISPNPGANAALKYWQAFATLPRFTDAEQKNKLAESLSKPLDAQARQMVSRAAYSLRMLHYGAAQPRCEWGIAYEDEGLSVLCPHGDAGRVLCNLACLSARLHFEDDHDAEAIDNLIDAMTLGRHISRDGPFFMLLTGYAIEHRAIETLALYLPKLDATKIEDLKKRLEALPPGGKSSTAMKYEEVFALDWFVRKVRETKDKEGLLTLLTRALDTPEKARAFLAECGGTAEGVLQCAEETRRSYTRMAKQLDLPPDQVAKAFEREEKKQAGNPVFKILFPALVKVRSRQALMEVRRAMLSAALAVRLKGQDALKHHPDPVLGGPFDYEAFEGGFELRSKRKEGDDKPLTLTVGRRGK